MDRRSLVLAVIAPAALLAILAAAPLSPARVPIALAAILWAPGHALLAIVYPLGSGRLASLERVALSFALGLAMAPIVGLALSVFWSLSPESLAIACLALTLALAIVAGWRAHAPVPAREPSPASVAPSTRATFAICGAALLVTGALFAAPLVSPRATSPTLALGDATGGLEGLARAGEVGRSVDLLVTMEAADAPVGARLVVTLDGPEGAVTLLDEEVWLGPRERGALPVHIDALGAGTHELVVRWELAPSLEVHAWLDASEVVDGA